MNGIDYLTRRPFFRQLKKDFVLCSQTYRIVNVALKQYNKTRSKLENVTFIYIIKKNTFL